MQAVTYVSEATCSLVPRPPCPAFVACSTKSGGESLEGLITWCVPLLMSL